MREIKFRGYNRKNNVWLYGFYLQNRGAHFVAPDEFATGKTWEDYEIDPGTLGQYTGLYDKKDQEIYKGDILFVEFQDKSGGYMLVGWNEKTASWGIMNHLEYQCQKEGEEWPEFKNHVLLAFLKHAIVCEVAGNIHDNPELLELREQNQNES